MQGLSNVSGDAASVGECSCPACASSFDQTTTIRASEVSERCGSLFTADGTVDSAGYVSLLRELNEQDAEKIRGMEGVEVDGSKIILKHPVSSSAKFMVALAILLALLLIAFVIFAILTYKGVVHITGVDLKTLIYVTNMIGLGLCGAFFSYFILAVGYLIGCGSDGGGRELESKLEKCAAVQKKVRDNLNKSVKEMQLCKCRLELANGAACSARDERLSRLMKSKLKLESGQGDLESSNVRFNIEAKRLEESHVMKKCEHDSFVGILGEENRKLLQENRDIECRLQGLCLDYVVCNQSEN